MVTVSHKHHIHHSHIQVSFIFRNTFFLFHFRFSSIIFCSLYLWHFSLHEHSSCLSLMVQFFFFSMCRHVFSLIIDIFAACRCPVLLAKTFLRRWIDGDEKAYWLAEVKNVALLLSLSPSLESPRMLLSWIVVRKPLLIPRRKMMPNFFAIRARIALAKKEEHTFASSHRSTLCEQRVAHKCGHRRALHDIAKLCELWTTVWA